MGGILPFGCIFIQLFFILNSIWSHQFYYMFGFLMLVYIILIITCSETTILLCYFHLCAEVRFDFAKKIWVRTSKYQEFPTQTKSQKYGVLGSSLGNIFKIL
jgi:hypothetical protein